MNEKQKLELYILSILKALNNRNTPYMNKDIEIGYNLGVLQILKDMAYTHGLVVEPLPEILPSMVDVKPKKIKSMGVRKK